MDTRKSGTHGTERVTEVDSKPCTEVNRRLTIDLGGGVELAFCFIPRAEFRMGSRNGSPEVQPVHRVIIPRDFWLAETPVTQAQYACFSPDHRSQFHGKSDHPVESVTWHQARKFCGWLKHQRSMRPWPDELADLEPDLPTETQWQFACRARTDTKYYTGDGERAFSRAGWYGEEWDKGGTHPVRGKTPNGIGLHDMHGNVWEWCRDVWSEDAYPHRAEGRIEIVEAGAPVDQTDERSRVFRGGSWDIHPDFGRSAVRPGLHPGYAYLYLGFRVGLFPGPSCPVK